MSRPTPREIERYFPRKIDEIAGNKSVLEYFKFAARNGPTNMILTGSTATGKTRTMCLGIKMLQCLALTEASDPCGKCSSCLQLEEARIAEYGLFAIVRDLRYHYVPLDCTQLNVDSVVRIVKEFEYDTARTIFYLDEVSHLPKGQCEAQLLKIISESSGIWMASGITTKPPAGKKGLLTQKGLSPAFVRRFSVKLNTSLPRQAELTRWIQNRARDWEIEIEKPDETIPILIERTGHRVGLVMNVFVDSALRDRQMKLDRVNEFDFDCRS